MSVDIAWEKIVAGEDGLALAEKIRDFVHAKFQQVTLPRFINSVHVHAFDLGSVSPRVEVKDICDPLPDFYEDDEDASSFDSKEDQELVSKHTQSDAIQRSSLLSREALAFNASAIHSSLVTPSIHSASASRAPLTQDFSQARPIANLNTSFNGMPQVIPRSSTPGIPGGTSNMTYFHFPAGIMSGAQTPLAAAVGSGTFSSQSWYNEQPSHPSGGLQAQSGGDAMHAQSHDHVTSRPQTAGSVSSPEIGSPVLPSSPENRPLKFPAAEKVSDDVTMEDISMSDRLAMPDMQSDRVQPNDLQVVARVTYDGDVKMMLTAQILLDYPMPSFVSIPLMLSITGVTFDGVAILAYIRKRMHFCFLDPEDAETLVGSGGQSTESEENSTENHQQANASTRSKIKSKFGGLLQEIRVESEIGRQENGKQVLKNVGKVEKFVLEQVRRIFEEEFVFPSFWTILV